MEGAAQDDRIIGLDGQGQDVVIGAQARVKEGSRLPLKRSLAMPFQLVPLTVAKLPPMMTLPKLSTATA